MEIIILDTPEEVGLLAADVMARYVEQGATLGLATG